MSEHFRSWRTLARFLRHLASSPAAFTALSVASAALIAAAPAAAQQAAPLSLQSALDRAIESDPGLRAAEAGVDAALGGVRQARVAKP